MTLTGEQLKAARALLRWDQKDLVAASKVSLATVKRLEAMPGPLQANAVTIEALMRALSAVGVEFIDDGLGEVGVVLRKKR